MVPNILHLVCLSILLSLFKPWARAELFTAIAEMEPLLETHKRIVDDLNDYVVKEEKRLAVLKYRLERYKVEHEKAIEDIPNYLGNPISAFTLIKRLTTDLDEIEGNIKNGTEYIKNVTMNHEDVKYPTMEDLAGAAQALTRLQTTYRFDVHDLAEGKLNGITYNYPMTATDCFEICKALYMVNDFNNSLAWCLESLPKVDEETNKKHTFTKIEVLEYIAFTYYLLGDMKNTLEWTMALLELDPRHRAATYVPALVRYIAEQEAAEKKDTGDEMKGQVEPNSEFFKYAALCRGEMEINSIVAKRLYCRYMSETHPFLRLAPMKVEQVYIDPDVFIFHNVLSDFEILFLQALAKSRLQRSVVHDPKTGEHIFTNHRTSKGAWLRDEESPIIARVSQRVADMTGLTVTTAEALQVVNYGIGGHYNPHYDFTMKHEHPYQESIQENKGNRIATVLFYMSDVAQGGATVFTELGLSVFPARGAALVWLNLHPSGEGDKATRHAACPVLRGSKWVCNKWLHEAGQEFIKPCNLIYQQEEIMRKIPRAVLKPSR